MLRLEVKTRPEANAVVACRADVNTVKFELSDESISLRDILTVDCLESAECTWALDEIRLDFLEFKKLVVKI